jgi:soluble lytic murein transglycosylase
MGAESSLTACRVAQPGRRLLQRWTATRRPRSNIARWPHSPGLDAQARNGFAVAEAACDLKLKRLSTAQVEALADSKDENGARRLYLLMELARNRNDTEYQQQHRPLMESSFPRSPWLAEALFSSGNMYMLRRDYPSAVTYYGYLADALSREHQCLRRALAGGLAQLPPGALRRRRRASSTSRSSSIPAAKETVSAIYWRGRLYETEDHKPASAAANYRALSALTSTSSMHKWLGSGWPRWAMHQPVRRSRNWIACSLSRCRSWTESFPTDSPHLAKARLLANAGLNDYIAQEIAADPDSASWSALAEAQIYASYGEPIAPCGP